MTFRCPGEGFGHHFGRLLVTLGSLFLDFEGTGKRLEFFMDFDGFWLPWGTPVPSGITQFKRDLGVHGPN